MEKKKADSYLCNLAGFFALGIVLFPTSAESTIECNLRCYISSSLAGIIHFAFATLFFLTLAYISYFIFTKSKGKKSPQKIKRNQIYKGCAIAMIGSLFCIALYLLWLKRVLPILDEFHLVFCFETIALVAFGFSWLTKGEFLLKDE